MYVVNLGGIVPPTIFLRHLIDRDGIMIPWNYVGEAFSSATNPAYPKWKAIINLINYRLTNLTSSPFRTCHTTQIRRGRIQSANPTKSIVIKWRIFHISSDLITTSLFFFAGVTYRNSEHQGYLPSTPNHFIWRVIAWGASTLSPVTPTGSR